MEGKFWATMSPVPKAFPPWVPLWCSTDISWDKIRRILFSILLFLEKIRMKPGGISMLGSPFLLRVSQGLGVEGLPGRNS